MNKLKFLIILVITITVSACGSRRDAITGAAPGEDAAVTSVIQKHYETEADFKTLQARMRVEFQNESTNQAVTVSYRMKKDDTIWLSGQVLGFPLAKVLITPESVQFFEKISGTYFDGDFRLLSDLLGTPLDFDKVQNLLIGQTIYNMQEERYELSESVRGYQLSPAVEGFMKKMFLLDAGNYRVLAQQISQEGQGRGVTITYPSYQEVEGRTFPGEIKVIASEGPSITQIEMDFRSVEFNVPVSFPFSIPSGSEEITLE